MLLNWTGSIEDAFVEKIVEHTNKLSGHRILEIYMNSTGGCTQAMEVIVDIINTSPEKYRLYANGEMYSAAFFIFFRVKCERRIIPQTIGMCHYIRASIDIDENASPYFSYDKITKQWMKEQKLWTEKFCASIGMSSSEIKRIKRKEEVYFDHKRLEEFLNYTPVI